MNAYLQTDETLPAYGLGFGCPRETKNEYQVVLNKVPVASVSSPVLFRRLADKWKRETSHQSQISERLQHPSYLQILRMGKTVVPLIIDELEERPDFWFFALATLTGENPIPADFTGTVSEAAELWINWGREKYAT